MRIVLLADDGSNGRGVRLGAGVAVFTLFLTILLSSAIGLMADRINSFLSKDMQSVLDDVRIVELREELKERHWDLVDRKEEIARTREEIRDRLNSLGLKFGQLQAQTFRLEAMGQRLTQLADVDPTEFNFHQAPGVGGVNPDGSPQESYEYPEFLAMLDQLQLKLQFDENGLSVLESLLMDQKNNQTMFPDAWPVKGGWISSLFGYRNDPFSGKKAFHAGVDIAGSSGSLIQAAASGIVVQSGKRSGYGNSVKIKHANGYTTLYAHAASVLVKLGEKVIKGQPVATVGSTGRSTGPHLHFEVLKDSRRVNPKKFLQAAR
ncbi:MAG: murein DD-endopeptidase MepM/ murein hydrolase activator NlpD [Parasphingorhabdus sp.]|jgi:murein DD-endopeptidase MepM/ murein hydrolase activator NlpD